MPRRKKQRETLHSDIEMKFDSAEEVRRWLLVLSKLENREMPRKMRSSPVTKNVKRSLLELSDSFTYPEPCGATTFGS